jgi:hypothetical protein
MERMQRCVVAVWVMALGLGCGTVQPSGQQAVSRQVRKDIGDFYRNMADSYFVLGYGYFALQQEALKMGDKDRAALYEKNARLYKTHSDDMKRTLDLWNGAPENRVAAQSERAPDQPAGIFSTAPEPGPVRARAEAPAAAPASAEPTATAPLPAETPAPAATETSAPVAAEAPAPIAIATPAPVAPTTSAPVVAETTASATVETPAAAPAPAESIAPAPPDASAPAPAPAP